MNKTRQIRKFIMDNIEFIIVFICVTLAFIFLCILFMPNFANRNTYTCIAREICKNETLNFDAYSYFGSKDIVYCSSNISKNLIWNVNFKVTNWTFMTEKYPNCLKNEKENSPIFLPEIPK